MRLVARSYIFVAIAVFLHNGPAAAQLIDPLAEPITPIQAPPKEATALVALGSALFQDTRLSMSGKVSCATCHDVRTNGASAVQAPLTQGSDGKPINTLTVFNAALSYRLNWRGNMRSLVDQADDTLHRRDTMSADPDRAVAAVTADPWLDRQFRVLYKHAPDWPSILAAIAAYERTLVTPDSRFDLWLKGDKNALTQGEIDGYKLFKSTGCISCHQGVGVGGNLFEVVGVAKDVLPDTGQVFRVPSLRNVAMTAPYFHDGSAATLDVAVSRMAAGQLGLNLSKADVSSIVLFLGSLTGRYRGHLVSSAP